jgi:beta-aspartyl-peptidase (threonine type)
MEKAVIAIHGGAGTLSRSNTSPEIARKYTEALHQTLLAGQAILAAGGSALDAVTEAVRLLEDIPLFNAGTGSVFTHAATHEMDACIMDGRRLDAGAVAGVRCVRNPILAARAVLDNSPHVLLISDGAEQFAREQGLEIVAPDFFSTAERAAQLRQARGQEQVFLDHDVPVPPISPDTKFGTVGAVALDSQGNLAAATSTGGMTNKRPGRVGDSPLPGAGCYANNANVAVSCTGTGEVFIRMLAAYDVAALMEYSGVSLPEAADRVIKEKLVALNGEGGLIAIDREGHVVMPFNTEGMYRGVAWVGDIPSVGIWQE